MWIRTRALIAGGLGALMLSASLAYAGFPTPILQKVEPPELVATDRTVSVVLRGQYMHVPGDKEQWEHYVIRRVSASGAVGPWVVCFRVRHESGCEWDGHGGDSQNLKLRGATWVNEPGSTLQFRMFTGLADVEATDPSQVAGGGGSGWSNILSVRVVGALSGITVAPPPVRPVPSGRPGITLPDEIKPPVPTYDLVCASDPAADAGFFSKTAGGAADVDGNDSGYWNFKRANSMAEPAEGSGECRWSDRLLNGDEPLRAEADPSRRDPALPRKLVEAAKGTRLFALSVWSEGGVMHVVQIKPMFARGE